MGITRREFLQMISGTAAGYLLSQSPVAKLIPIREEERIVTGRNIEKYVISTCLLCPGACGIKARIVDNRLVSIYGNPFHSITRGGLCAKGLSGVHLVYSPDRIKRPLKRIGKRGEGKFEPIEWEEAFQIVTSKLLNIRENNNPQAFVFIDGSNPGSMNRLIDRFTKAYGTPNHIRDYYKDRMEYALYTMQGLKQLPAFDIKNSSYILSFGTNLINSWWSPVLASKSLGEFRQGREDIRGELVQLDTKLSLTAGKADSWIPIKPGGYGAFALAVAYVIVKENLYDRKFIENYTQGFEEWRKYLLERVRLDEISTLTGVAVDTIIRTAKEFARKSPSVAIADENATNAQGGLYTAMAIYALNALVGSIERKGGALVTPPVPYTRLPPVSLDSIAEDGLSKERIDRANTWVSPMGEDSVIRLLSSVDEAKPYPIEVMFLYYSNPVFSLPQPEKTRAILSRIPFIVSFSPFMDETTAMADLVLPDHTFLERWDDVVHPSVHPYSSVGIVKPVIKPIFNTKSSGDVIIELAKRLQGTVRESIPWNNYIDYLKENLRGVFDAKRGTNFTDIFEESQIRLLEERGFWLPGYKDFDEFWEKLTESGGWVDPVYHYREWGRVFKTPSRKFEFKSDLLREHIESGFLSYSEEHSEKVTMEGYKEYIGINGKDNVSPYIPQLVIKDTAENEKLALVIFRPFTLSSGSLAPFPWLQEIMGFQLNVMWDSWAEIHPETARKLRLKDGDNIRIESISGEVTVMVKLNPGCLPDVIHIPYGFGHKNYSNFTKNIGANPNQLLPLKSDGLFRPSWMVPIKVKKEK